ncbi:hypothetical protein K503DRAFT_804324 [Rhizopogon vinicolor AM-OR11-026]|uniref:Uncharacterized protein n=1 Tax=Rhizopogon vinicolor AM-OR11-026 TaxID=1314800 RepID=A0A1B7MLN1_9AGAM|nr:hypothetical protein K503DRAFT_804324 [Rhizopogon vinicolor AM-OR11-026]
MYQPTSQNSPYNNSAFGGLNRMASAPTGSPHLGQRKLPDFRSSSPHVERSETHHTVMTKTSWLETARESTIHFKQHGSPIPLVWVLVEDNVIPPNAVPFGEDKGGLPLYIARALLEGVLYLGKIGPHLPHALISYGGREHQIKHYEVLVCASQLRWGLPSFESAGSLSQGTVILAQQNQQLAQSQQGSAAWNSQAGGFSPRGPSGGFTTQTGFSNVRSATNVRETRNTYNSHETSTFIGTTLSVNDIPRFIPNMSVVPPVDDRMKKLASYKTVILIDDSISMAEEQSWTLVREALAGIVDLANQYGSQGIDLHFLHHHDFHKNIKTSREVQQIFDRLNPDGQDTPTATKLEELINHYLPLVERKYAQHDPIDIIVITDGVATDDHALPEVIVNAAHRLERGQVPDGMFGIQFVQIGTDEEAAAALRGLDDHLAKQFKIRDIVDTTPFDPQQGAFNTQYMLKILLGGINKILDNGGPVPGDLLSPLVDSPQRDTPQRGNPFSPHSR